MPARLDETRGGRVVRVQGGGALGVNGGVREGADAVSRFLFLGVNTGTFQASRSATALAGAPFRSRWLEAFAVPP